MHFSSLKLNGFKSFVDPTELLIEPGLTGIVGPNGCGKSNLVEALRWVMGETSAKQIRGAEMDDVIFSGTALRPGRNNATVELHLENPDRDAPAVYNDGNPITVSRHIRRGVGSSFRINSKEVRARDLQLLFADAATGARSTAIVNQGQIGAIINAKPDQRRHLLEEAAGITGLHSRRHEAELRLCAAEGNVERLDDVLLALQAQLQGLKRQVRQASRYRSLSGRIRKAEAMLLYSRWAKADFEVQETRSQLTEIEREVLERAQKATAAATEQTNVAAVLPNLRRQESEEAANVQRLTIEGERLDDETQRIGERADSAKAQIEVLLSDVEREQTLRSDAGTQLANLTAEAEELLEHKTNDADFLDEAAAKVLAVRKVVGGLEATVAALTEQAAAARITRRGLDQRRAKVEDRLSRLTLRAKDIAVEQVEIKRRCVHLAEPGERQRVESMQEEADQLRKVLHKVARARDVDEQELELTQKAERESSQLLMAADAQRTRLVAEIEALTEAINVHQSHADDEVGSVSKAAVVFDQLIVIPGYETALGAALGDDLSASLDEGAPASWRLVQMEGAPQAMPEGVSLLSDFVDAPEALALRLGQIGLVDDAEEGRRLARKLVHGQRLVSLAGDMWRWDGFSILANASTSATRLRQRSRLMSLQSTLGKINAQLSELTQNHQVVETTLGKVRKMATAARDAESEARAASVSADQELAGAREAFASAVETVADDRARLQVLTNILDQLNADRIEAETEKSTLDEEIKALPDLSEARTLLEEERASLADQRQKLEEQLRSQEKLFRDQQTRSRRIVAIEEEALLWRHRDEGAESQIESLVLRRAVLERELESLRARPTELKSRRESLLVLCATAEQTRKKAADALAAADVHLDSCDRVLRKANDALADCREGKARIEGKRDQAVALRTVEVQQMEERLGCTPLGALALSELDSPDQMPELSAVERQMERLLRERENMGPVNLRAEEE
ncbi:MAG: Chromosome partition protein Smc, partial [Alphaproteobacteria bacterium MarineAlpha9_Bin5]